MKSKSIIDVLHWLLGMFFNFAIVVAVGIALYFITIRGFEFGETLAADMVAVGEDYEISFVLDQVTPASEVSRELEELGIINSSMLYNLELFLMGRIREYQPGTYILNRNMTNTQVHRTFLRTYSVAEHEVVRIPEGWTTADMAEYFESRGFFTAEEFIYVATYGHFDFAFLRRIPERPNGLEGYLFPDTYHVPLNPSPGDIIWRMLRRFDEVFDADMIDQAYEMGMTMDEVVIMASIIERETRFASERPLVSQVIHNRMNIGMHLEMCSTVKFGMEDPPERLSIAQTQIDTPYNTYVHPGLPIGPICNPGAAALRAVLNPSGDDYLFFVLYDFETGQHFFSNNFADHQAADDRARARQ
jgi:UPF0755 protein